MAFFSSLVVGAALLLSQAATAQTKPHLAVMDFESRNVEHVLAESATEAVVGALRDLRVFKVISRAEIKQMLTLDRERALLSNQCSETSCLAELGQALGARWLVVGQLTGIDRQKGPFNLRVQLFDMKKAEVVAEQTRPDLKSAREVLRASPVLGLAVVRPILDKEQGFLELSCRENEANVTIDGRLVGVTPFAVQRLGWGPHRVVVEKEGFIAWAKDVQVEKNQSSTELVSLIPSPEFVDGYRHRNNLMRLGAWLGTGLAVVGAGAAAYLQFGAINKRYDNFKGVQSAFNSHPEAIASACSAFADKLSLGAGDPVRTDRSACYTRAHDYGAVGSSEVLLARIGVGAAVVGLGAAVVLFLAGGDPGRYDAYRTEISAPAETPPAVKPSAALVPLPGGGMAVVRLSF
jgi:TolB-like protein